MEVIEKRLVTVKEAAIYFGRSEYSFRQLVHKGLIPVVNVGKKWWLDLKDLEKFIRDQKTTF
jgi:excisionase family DNA binding protein